MYKCKEFDDSSIIKLCQGGSIFYKGWILVGNLDNIDIKDIDKIKTIYDSKILYKIDRKRYNRKIYTFVNDKLQNKCVGTIYDFSKQCGYKIKSIRRICYKSGDTRKSLFGWKCLDPK